MIKNIIFFILIFNLVFSVSLFNMAGNSSSKTMINILGSKFLSNPGDFEINPSALSMNDFGFVLINYNMPYSMGYLIDNTTAPFSGNIFLGFPLFNYFAVSGGIYYFNDKQTSLDLTGAPLTTDILNNSITYTVSFRYSYIPYNFKNNSLNKFNKLLLEKSLKNRFNNYNKLKLKLMKFNFGLGITGKAFNYTLDKSTANSITTGYLFDAGAYLIIFYDYYLFFSINNFSLGLNNKNDLNIATQTENVNFILNASFTYNNIYKKYFYYYFGIGYQSDLINPSKIIIGTSLKYIINNTTSINGIFLMKNIFHSIGLKLSYNFNTEFSSVFNYGTTLFFDLGTIVKYLRFEYSISYKQNIGYDNLFSLSYNFLENPF